ncbi:hypothetical protein DAI22_05g079400 [Oryza sativa Japonica Group]|nr:hypothetical protein DAI22_05g079400 [Oryza sativa Japonica Group]
MQNINFRFVITQIPIDCMRCFKLQNHTIVLYSISNHTFFLSIHTPYKLFSILNYQCLHMDDLQLMILLI